MITVHRGGGTIHVGVRATNSTSQTLTTGVATKLTFDTEQYDTDDLHSVVSNTDRFTVPTGGDGVYFVTTYCQFAGHATGIRYLRILTDAPAEVGQTRVVPGAANAIFVTTSGMYYMTGGEYFQIEAYQNSGGNLAVSTHAVAVHRVGSG